MGEDARWPASRWLCPQALPVHRLQSAPVSFGSKAVAERKAAVLPMVFADEAPSEGRTF